MDFGAIFGSIGSALLEFVLPTLATIIGGLVVGLLNRQLKKVGLELSQAQQDRIKELIQNAIRATEEAARRESIPGPEKRAMTIATAAEAISKDPTIPDLDRAQLEAAIDAQLPVVRKEIALVPSTPATFGRKAP